MKLESADPGVYVLSEGDSKVFLAHDDLIDLHKQIHEIFMQMKPVAPEYYGDQPI